MGVVFDEKPLTSNRARRTSFLARLIIKTGIAKTDTGAQIVMLIITVCALLSMAMLLPDVLRTPETPRAMPTNNAIYKMP